jgi:hypothetical protein
LREEFANDPGALEAALAKAVVSNDVSETGRLLGGRATDQVRVRMRNLPSSLLRRPEFCSALDVAVGAGAVEGAKYLLEFHSATRTRETLLMTIFSVCFELVRLIWGRVPERSHRKRVDLMKVAADFHRTEVLSWLFRDADDLEREVFIAFAIHQRLADALLTVLAGGFRPWWAREAAAAWPRMSEVEFRRAPNGFYADGGWWTSPRCETSGIPSLFAGPARVVRALALVDARTCLLCVGSRCDWVVGGEVGRSEVSRPSGRGSGDQSQRIRRLLCVGIGEAAQGMCNHRRRGPRRIFGLHGSGVRGHSRQLQRHRPLRIP